MKRGNVELEDAIKGRMKCHTCGQIWFAQIKPESKGKFYRGAWKCPDRCDLKNDG